MILITLRDKVGGTWSNPVAVQNEAAAKRDFAAACNDTKSLIGQHPEDFELYAIADWMPSLEDGKDPIFRAYDKPKFLVQGVANEHVKA